MGVYTPVAAVTPYTDPDLAVTTFDANTILAATADDTPVALTVGEQTLVGRITAGNIAALTPAQVRTLLDVPTNAAAVLDALFDAHTILFATTDNTPAALTVGEDRVVGRVAAGNIAALTGAQIKTLVGLAAQGAYTQTYATADRTIAAATAATPAQSAAAVPTTAAGLAVFGYSEVQANAIVASLNQLRLDLIATNAELVKANTDVLGNKKNVNALVDDSQVNGLAA